MRIKIFRGKVEPIREYHLSPNRGLMLDPYDATLSVQCQLEMEKRAVAQEKERAELLVEAKRLGLSVWAITSAKVKKAESA